MKATKNIKPNANPNRTVTGNKVIFLDIDGVVNYFPEPEYSDWRSHKKIKNVPSCCGFMGVQTSHLKILKKIVDATDSIIVLVSSWKEGWERYVYSGFKILNETSPTDVGGKYLHNKFRRAGLQIDETTLQYETFWGGRADGIIKYLNAHPAVTHYVILDDEMFAGYRTEPCSSHLVKTDERVGLTEENVNEAIEILGGSKWVER